ncbi:MAG: helix-turn-helix transcriptional regulator [Clostridia bacterium]|nr:helix-turn-helix transcriptional regulator [Clostridia bacterium]
MIHIRVKELLEKNKKSKYWFVKNMEGSYQSLSKLMNDDTSGIKFETLEKMCKVFNCEIGELITLKKDDEN